MDKKIPLERVRSLWGTHWALRTGTASHEPTDLFPLLAPEGQTVSGVDSWPLERLAQTVAPESDGSELGCLLSTRTLSVLGHDAGD